MIGVMMVFIVGGISPYVLAADEPAVPPPATRGSISKIDGNTLTLHVLRGPSGIMRPVKLSDKTAVIRRDGKAGTVADLKVDQWVKVSYAVPAADFLIIDALKIEPSLAPWDEEKLIKIANDEAKAAYRKKQGLAPDAPVRDFDHDNKPTGAVHKNRVEPMGDNWRVILSATLTVQGVPSVVSYVEVPLDNTGKLVGVVKWGI